MSIIRRLTAVAAVFAIALCNLPLQTVLADEADGNTVTSKTVFIDGIRPVTVYYQQSDTYEGPQNYKRSEAVSKFDLRDYGLVTDVKSQGSYGTCWAFGALGSLESNLLINGLADSDIDLSERHLAWFAYNGGNSDSDDSMYAAGDTYISAASNEYEAGGSRAMSAPTLARLYGAADESLAEYSRSGMSGVDDSLQTVSNIAVKDIEYLPETTEQIYNTRGTLIKQSLSGSFNSAIAALKDAVMNKGAVSVGYYADDGSVQSKTGSYWNETTDSYYFDASQMIDGSYYQYPNHEVSIIGWDDGYPASNFSISPAGDGAWIVKNSWGTSWGDSGYFYISYYDLSLCEPTVFTAEEISYSSDNESHTYDNIYQYDGIGFGLQTSSTSKSTSYANVFTARSKESVSAIGVFSSMQNSTLEYKLYRSLSSGTNPESGTLAASGTVTLENPGYKTIDLSDQSFVVSDGEKYSAVIRLSYISGGKKYYQKMVETEYHGYSDIDCSTGQSFYKSSSSSSWKDSALNGLGNTVVKAFSNNVYETFDSSVSASAITYGDTLESSTITGNALEIDGQTVSGSYEWENKELIPNAGTDEYIAIFTPYDDSIGAVKASISVAVAKRELAYKINDAVRKEGEANPEFTCELISGEVVSGDDISIVMSCAANEQTAFGSYNITGYSTGESAENYDITIQNGVLTIAKGHIKVTSVKLSLSSKTLISGKSVTLKAAVSPSTATYPSVTWKSSNSNIASVTQKGVVKAKKAGKTTITATADGISAKFTITVKPAKAKKLKVRVKSGDKVRITFKKAAGSSKTQIKLKTGSGRYKTVSKTKLRKIVKKLKKGSYKIKVRGYRKIGGKTYYGAYSKTVSFKIK